MGRLVYRSLVSALRYRGLLDSAANGEIGCAVHSISPFPPPTLAAMAETSDSPREKLQSKLRELFQFESSDLDFGIYRILNYKRDDIEQFIEEDLLDAVGEALDEMTDEQRGEIERKLEEERAKLEENLGQAAINEYGELAEEHHDIPMTDEYLELQEKLDEIEVAEVTEARIYTDLLKFFSRYYDKGDFTTLRRYSSRDHKYMVPYDGQEVMLHWANKEQYYIKTGERFTDYEFYADEAGRDQKVWFRLVAANTPEDNNKSDGRYFILTNEDEIEYDGDENVLTVPFAYRPLTEDETDAYLDQYADITGDRRKTVDRSVLNAVTEQQILKAVDAPRMLGRLKDEHDDSSTGSSVLGHHLDRYTAANTHDYFIHKDLGGFLRRELDFFLKNEVLDVDNYLLGDGGEQAYERELLRARAVRRIAERIIDFLAQIEDFQKRLFEKKKFVTETNCCVTLDRVPEDLYPTIVDNKEQLEAWFALYGIDQWDSGPESTMEVDQEFLEGHKSLMIDTGYFEPQFKEALLSSFENVDQETDGVLVHGENFQTLQTLSQKYEEAVDCVYADPPYNTDASPIAYKNGFKSSTWTSMIFDRAQVCKSLLKKDADFICAIDDTQMHELHYVLKNIFPTELGTITVRSNPSGRPKQTGYSVSHEYLLFFGASNDAKIGRIPPTDEQMSRFSHEDDKGRFEWRNLRREGSGASRSARPKLFYPISIQSGEIRVPEISWDEGDEKWILEEDISESHLVYPTDNEGNERRWRWSQEKVKAQASRDEMAIREDQSGRDYIYYKRRPNEEGVACVSSWFDAKYSATEHGTAVIKELFGDNIFTFPKSIHAVKDALYVAGASEQRSLVVDHFAGSGTTGQAVIDLNREDDGNRKYILVEMGEYFDTVMMPRIQKVVFADEWDDGVPQFDEDGETGGVSHMFKYQRLESYEDTLNNIRLEEPDVDQEELPDDYMLGYMLDVESRGSKSLLSRDAFDKPFDYKLDIQRGDVTPRPTTVDLQETFHYLIGMRVESIEVHEHQDREYHVSRGQVPGPDGLESAVVVWRDLYLEDSDPEGNEPDIDWEEEKKWAEDELLEEPVDRIYANGPSGITGYDRIEHVFKEKMDPAYGGES
jgi:adenine-specific DNA-methyltransferase